MSLPEATKTPCNQCPWRRESAPGWLGPLGSEEWVHLAHSDLPIACHTTIVEDGSFEGALQCAGAAQYRANVVKSPRDPEVAVAEERNTEKVFANAQEFYEHHGRTSRMDWTP